MTPIEFQERLRTAIDHHLDLCRQSARVCQIVLDQAKADWDQEPELFAAIAQGELARLERLMKKEFGS